MQSGPYFDQKLETEPWADIERRVFGRTQEQIARLYTVSPYYKRRLDGAGVKPSDIKDREDLARIPFSDKDEERRSQEAAPPLGEHLSVDMERVVRIHSSSGTTGTPTFFALTQRDLDTWDTVAARCYYTMGVRASDLIVHLGNLSMFVGGIPSVTGPQRIGATVVPVGATAGTRRALEMMDHLGATVISATPSFAVYLAEMVRKELQREPASMGLRLMIVGGEPGGQIAAVREQLSAMWQCEVRDSMGIGEICGAIWAESSDKAGMHFCAQDEILIELIDPSTGELKPLVDGAEGELVYTPVTREATPLLRFRSHDFVQVRVGEVPSGRTSPRITPLGRTDDMLLVRGVNVFPSAVRDVVSSFVPEVTGHIRIVVEGTGPLVKPPLLIRVEVANNPSEDQRRALSARIVERIKHSLYFSAAVELVPEGSLERSSTKTNYIERKLTS